MTKQLFAGAIALCTMFGGGIAAYGEVRIGNNVRIGGHDVAPQTFNQQRRGEFYIYEDGPSNPGCRWRVNADGSRTKECHLKRK